MIAVEQMSAVGSSANEVGRSANQRIDRKDMLYPSFQLRSLPSSPGCLLGGVKRGQGRTEGNELKIAK